MRWIGLVLLAGCEQLTDIKDKVEGLTNPMVSQALLLGVAEPESGEVDLSGTDFDKGTGLNVFLADASSVDDLEEAPITGADVRIRVGDTAAVVVDEAESGAYLATGDDGLEYEAGADAVLSIDYGDESFQSNVTLPPPAQVDIPDTHQAGEPLTVDLSEGSYDSVLAVVINGATGDVTWQNRPETVREIYDFTHGTGAGVSELTIPGSAFPAGCACAVGIAGMRAASADEFVNQNTALSSLIAGQLKFYPVIVP